MHPFQRENMHQGEFERNKDQEMTIKRRDSLVSTFNGMPEWMIEIMGKVELPS